MDMSTINSNDIPQYTKPKITVSYSAPLLKRQLDDTFIMNEPKTTEHDSYYHTGAKSETDIESKIICETSNDVFNEQPNRKYSPETKKKEWQAMRQASISSLCSVDTSYASDLSDFDYDDNISPSDDTKKESMWGKVRKIVRWQPFIQSYKKEYPWIQLAGHSGGFKAGKNGTILKKCVQKEADALQKLMNDQLKSFVPEFKHQIHDEGEVYIEMQDLLQEFDSPSVMDCKMGTRTYLEEEVSKVGKARKDLYEKMILVDPSEPTDSENETCSCTKSRYMQWREQLSSTATLGFRIEGIKRGDLPPDKDFKKVKSEEDVSKIFQRFIECKREIQVQYLERLKEIRDSLLKSTFFSNHELVGSSLLFVHDANGKAGIWLIDFGKTTPLKNGHVIDHKSDWILGNHEDGYLIGLNNMINIWSNLLNHQINETNN